MSVYLKVSLFLFLSIIVFPGYLLAQDDSLNVEEADTIVINKEALIIKQQVSVVEHKSSSSFALHASVSPVYYFNYYDVCESCKGYLEKLKDATSPSVSYSINGGLIFIKNRFYSNLELGYSIIREKFDYKNLTLMINAKNRYTYADANLSVGYKFHQKNMSIIPYAGMGVSRLISSNGYTLSKTDSTAIELSKENPFVNYSQRVVSGIHFMYQVSERVDLTFGPWYSVNIRSLVQRDHFYIQQRNLLGIRFGLVCYL